MFAVSQEAGGSPPQEQVARALLLLSEALQIVDSLGERPDVGAKLNEIIELLDEERAGE